jgi:hypothetical protein
MDIQGDLMIWCPELGPTFVNGADPVTGIRERADNGATPHGIHAGWIWTIWLPYYAPAQRQILYAEIKRKGWTHVAIQVAQPTPDGGYHGLRPMSQADCDEWGARCMEVHAELLAQRLIPICAGVAPVNSPGGAPVARGFDPNVALIAIPDWDNNDHMAGRTKAVHDAFPNALVYCERPGPTSVVQPRSDGDDPIPATASNGGAWLREMQQRYPRFVGVLYEVNNSDGLEKCVAELTACHSWFRDVQEVRFEIDTYQKFWNNLREDVATAFNEQLQARCPWLQGFMSGGVPHPPPAADEGDVVHAASDGTDMIADVTYVGGPNIGSWPITTKITRLELRRTGVYVEFSKQSGNQRWPNTVPDGQKEPGVDMGPLQYSMGLAVQINGRWFASAPIQCWYGLHESGGPIQVQDIGDGTRRSQILANWFYDQRWTPLNGHRVQPGETLGFFVCAGDARNSFNPVKERSQIVRLTLPAPLTVATFTY